MSIIICPGIHEPDLTESFILEWLDPVFDSLKRQNQGKVLIYPGHSLLALSSLHIVQFLGDRLQHELESPVIFLSFSAGVVGAIGGACAWQLLGGNVKAFIAIDGWGVPLSGNFPIHRMSHDYFTHWSSSLLGGGHNNFYAQPPVDHLSMWRSPQKVKGCWVDSSVEVSSSPVRLTASEFLHILVNRYEEN